MATFKDIKQEISDNITTEVNINGQTVNVKHYLPINKKLELITKVLDQVSDNPYSFANPVQMDVYTVLEIIFAYTDIEFSEEEKENPAELYDQLEIQNIINPIISTIPESEYKFLMEGIEETIKAYYSYRNSVKGIIEDVTTDYSNLNLDANNIREKIADPENLSLVKDILTKLG